jgi:hypothetical protein
MSEVDLRRLIETRGNASLFQGWEALTFTGFFVMSRFLGISWLRAVAF